MSNILKAVLPFLYIPVGIVLPMYLFNTDYGWSVLVGFWIPVTILSFIVLPKVSHLMRMAFVVTFMVLIPVTVLFEYLCLLLDIWNFSEEASSLWGFRIAGAPVEEFIFWFGATPLCLLVYLYYTTIAGKGGNQ
jgi:lycopene cyclase domain-containing protein